MASRRTMELWVGLFALGGLVALATLSFKVGNLSSADVGEAYDVKARFTNIGQLKVKAPVTIGGVLIGRVTAIQMDDSFNALVTLSISKRHNRIPADSSASILTAGLLGEQYIALEPGGDTENLKAGDELLVTQPALVLEKLISQFLYNQAGKSDDKK